MSVLQIKAREEGSAVDWKTIPVGSVLKMYKQDATYTVIARDHDKLTLQADGLQIVPLNALLADFACTRGLITIVKPG